MQLEYAIDIINDVVADYADSTEKNLWKGIKEAAENEEIYESTLYLFGFTSVFDKYTADTGKTKDIDEAWESLINVILED